jgi:hypothetical protein
LPIRGPEKLGKSRISNNAKCQGLSHRAKRKGQNNKRERIPPRPEHITGAKVPTAQYTQPTKSSENESFWRNRDRLERIGRE